MTYIPMPKNAAGDAVLTEQKAGTSSTVDDGGLSITVDTDDGSLSTYHKPDYSILSTEAKPTLTVTDEGKTLEYTDNGIRFRWTGTTWIKTHISGANITSEFYLELSKGNIAGHTLLHKFGHSDAISTTMVPVTSGNVYQTPTTAQSLELVSTAVADNQAGIGARSITIIGLNANWDEQTVVANMHATDGTIAQAVTGTWMRVYRAYVTDTGSYGTSTVGSHQGVIDLQGTGAGVLWARLDTHGGFPLGQSQIAAGTVPKGKTAYIGNLTTETDSSKAIDILGFQRLNANVISAPFGAMRGWSTFTGITDSQDLSPKTWHGPFPEYTDVGFMAVRSSAGTSSVSIDFEVILVDN